MSKTLRDMMTPIEFLTGKVLLFDDAKYRDAAIITMRVVQMHDNGTAVHVTFSPGELAHLYEKLHAMRIAGGVKAS